MNLDLIKISGIFIVTLCCIIAAYTDVKSQIIPNRLNISLFLIGIVIVTFYFYKLHIFNYFYYVSILLVFAFSYILWYLGVWAGGDVKLLTALSTLFIPEFLDVVPKWHIFNVVLPFNLTSFKVPTFLLIFNSVLAIIPLITIMIFIKILSDKRHLIDEFIKTFNFKEGVLSLNSLIISYHIILELNVYHTALKVLFILIITIVLFKIMKKDVFFIILSFIVLFYQLLTSNVIFYACELIVLLALTGIRNMFQGGIVKEALTRNINKNNLVEGMILAYPLYCENGEYYFKKNNTFRNIMDMISNNYEKNLVCGVKSSGLSKKDIVLIQKNLNQDFIQIKEALSFAPFILTGLLITLCLGNTYELMLYLLGMI